MSDHYDQNAIKLGKLISLEYFTDVLIKNIDVDKTSNETTALLLQIYKQVKSGLI